MKTEGRRAQLESATRKLFDTLSRLDEHNNRDIPAIIALYDPDVDFRMPFLETPGRFKGVDAVRGLFGKMQGMFSSIEYFPEHFHVDAERDVVTVEMNGRRVLAQSGIVVDLRYVFVIGFRNGRVKQWREYVYAPNQAEISRRLSLE